MPKFKTGYGNGLSAIIRHPDAALSGMFYFIIFKIGGGSCAREDYIGMYRM